MRDVHELLAEHEPRAERRADPIACPDAPATSPTPSRSARSRASCCARSRASSCVEPAEWELCCGSAGIYNLVQPEPAAELGRRKAANLEATGAQAVAAANPGCALQIAVHAGLPVHHPMTLLHASIERITP